MKYKWKINKNNLIICSILLCIAFFITTCNYVFFEKGFLSCDVSVWVNVSRRIGQGDVIYRDIFDHKGPVLYFLYSIICVIPNQIGVWIFDFLCNSVTLFMLYFTLKIFINDKWKIFSVISICTIYIMNLCRENPGVESISLAFTMISLYWAVKYFFDNKSFNTKVAFSTALCFSIVVLLRPNLVLLWALLYLYIAIKLLREKKIKELLKIIGISVLGCCVIFIPTILYFVANNAFDSFIDVYINFNLKYQNADKISFLVMLRMFFIETYYILPIIFIIFASLVIVKNKMQKEEKKLLLFSFIYFLIELVIVVFPGRAYNHYLISMIPTFIIPLIMFVKYIRLGNLKILLLIILVFMNMVEYCYIQKNKYIYYNYLKDIKGHFLATIPSMSEDYDVLALGNHTMFYLMIDKYYKGKYMYQLPLTDNDQNMTDIITKDISENLPKYIINTRLDLSKPEDELDSFEKNMKSILDEKYTEIGEYVYERIK